jgi:hypothetical protein
MGEIVTDIEHSYIPFDIPKILPRRCVLVFRLMALAVSMKEIYED